jgi:membrane protein required for colicin V production
MNEVDALVMLVIALSCVFGLLRGLIKEFFSLLTWVTASVVARAFGTNLAAALEGMIENSNVRFMVAFSLIVGLIMIGGAVLNSYMSKRFAMPRLKNADRFMGGVFGIARGGVIALMVIYILRGFIVETELWQQSILIPYAMETIEWSQDYIGDYIPSPNSF